MTIRPRRGGLGVRHAQQQKQDQAKRYRLTGVQVGSLITECLDPYRRWELGHRFGVLLRNGIENITVQWEGEDEFTHYNSGDARYKVDTNLWRITPPKQQSVFDVIGGEGGRPSPYDKPDILGRLRNAARAAYAPALTTAAGSGSIASSPARGDTTEESDMATPRKRSAAKKAATPPPPPEEIEELDDELDDIEVDLEDALDSDIPEDDDAEKVDDTPAKGDKVGVEAERETYTPKQIAARIGTDAKTLRKFFRSAASTVEPVGQGGRYVFAAEDLPKIKAEFEKQQSAPRTRSTSTGGSKRGSTKSKSAGPVVEVEDDDEILELDDEEPTADDLEEIDDIELDDIEEED